MPIRVDEIKKLAELSRIELTQSELEKMRGEFDAILEYVAAINRISSDVPENARSIVAQVNVLREDKDPHESGIHTEALLAAAPGRKGDYIKVKKIL